MKEIKFRAWDNTPKEIYGQIMLPWNDLLSLDREGLLPLRDILSGTHTNLIPMQFTGLLDKNGKEIYEGDIIQLPFYFKEAILPVKWGVGGWWATGLGWFKTLGDIAAKCEVIGNIYEHPELLKEGKK